MEPSRRSTSAAARCRRPAAAVAASWWAASWGTSSKASSAPATRRRPFRPAPSSRLTSAAWWGMRQPPSSPATRPGRCMYTSAAARGTSAGSSAGRRPTTRSSRTPTRQGACPGTGPPFGAACWPEETSPAAPRAPPGLADDGAGRRRWDHQRPAGADLGDRHLRWVEQPRHERRRHGGRGRRGLGFRQRVQLSGAEVRRHGRGRAAQQLRRGRRRPDRDHAAGAAGRGALGPGRRRGAGAGRHVDGGVLHRHQHVLQRGVQRRRHGSGLPDDDGRRGRQRLPGLRAPERLGLRHRRRRADAHQRHGRRQRRLERRRHGLGSHRPGVHAERHDALQRDVRRQREAHRQPVREPLAELVGAVRRAGGRREGRGAGAAERAGAGRRRLGGRAGRPEQRAHGGRLGVRVGGRRQHGGRPGRQPLGQRFGSGELLDRGGVLHGHVGSGPGEQHRLGRGIHCGELLDGERDRRGLHVEGRLGEQSDHRDGELLGHGPEHDRGRRGRPAAAAGGQVDGGPAGADGLRHARRRSRRGHLRDLGQPGRGRRRRHRRRRRRRPVGLRAFEPAPDPQVPGPGGGAAAGRAAGHGAGVRHLHACRHDLPGRPSPSSRSCCRR